MAKRPSPPPQAAPVAETKGDAGPVALDAVLQDLAAAMAAATAAAIAAQRFARLVARRRKKSRKRREWRRRKARVREERAGSAAAAAASAVHLVPQGAVLPVNAAVAASLAVAPSGRRRTTNAEAAVLPAARRDNQANELLRQAGRAIRQAKEQRDAALERAAVVGDMARRLASAVVLRRFGTSQQLAYAITKMPRDSLFMEGTSGSSD